MPEAPDRETPQYIYFFGGGKADGNESMKNLLGGKGANLAEMAGHPKLKLPVPPGFTVTTEVCTYYLEHERRYPAILDGQVMGALRRMERLTGKFFGDARNPLLVSVRSGARKSMPGMMETVLNVGLNETTIRGLIEQSGDARFAYDAYRRLIMMYADVVMEKAAGMEPKGKGIRKQLDDQLEHVKKVRGYASDTELTVDELKALVKDHKATVKKVLGRSFPDDPYEQLWGGIGAVFASWNGKRAVEYRRIEKIPDEWGTAVNVQAMVFGNMGNDSATGVAFTRNPGTGENKFYGEYLVNAQGEDVVAGIRTPAPVNEYSKNGQSAHLPTLEKLMPKAYKELNGYQQRLERHYHDMQDIEFTIQRGRLFMLQTRNGKRTAAASLRIAVEMANEGLIDRREAVKRVNPAALDQLLRTEMAARAVVEAAGMDERQALVTIKVVQRAHLGMQAEIEAGRRVVEAQRGLLAIGPGEEGKEHERAAEGGKARGHRENPVRPRVSLARIAANATNFHSQQPTRTRPPSARA